MRQAVGAIHLRSPGAEAAIVDAGGGSVSGSSDRSGANDGTGATRCRLSIVVINYNHGAFLSRCLEAILAQTQAPDEVLMIDDASTDDSLDVTARFTRLLPGFRLIRHDINRGVVATMNEGLAEARGTHVLFAAADDWIEPELVAISTRMLEAYPNAGLCSALTQLATEAGETTGPFRTSIPLRRPGYITPEHARELLIRDQPWFNGNTTIVNRVAALACGGYRPELTAYTDMFLNTQLALRHGACFTPRFLAVWRRMDNGYAASLSTDPSAMLATLEAAKDLMSAANGLFTSEYVRRWAGRWRYTASRAALAAPSPLRRQWLARLLPARFRPSARLIDALQRLPLIGAPLAIMLLFAILRAPDTGAVLRRRLGWILQRRRLERTAS